jgi:hypothetical protein
MASAYAAGARWRSRNEETGQWSDIVSYSHPNARMRWFLLSYCYSCAQNTVQCNAVRQDCALCYSNTQYDATLQCVL